MAENSKIEWTDASWNPLRARRIGRRHITEANGRAHTETTEATGWHCEHVSEGCRNCYAEAMNKRLGTGLDYKPGNLAPRGTVEMFLDEKLLLAPLKWRKPRRIFLSSMTDIFGDWVSDADLDRIFAVMALCPQHVFQVLTKRPERMRDYLNRACGRIADAVMALRITPLALAKGLGPNAIGPLPHIEPGAKWFPLPNVWLGVSVEDQAAADARIPHLLATPAAVRFLSCEPLLGPVDLTKISERAGFDPHFCMAKAGIGWVIAGGESGPGARPMHPDWARSLRDQCAAAGVPFLFKQWGEWAPTNGWPMNHTPGIAIDPNGKMVDDDVNPDDVGGQRFMRVGKKRAGRLLDGVQHDGVPA